MALTRNSNASLMNVAIDASKVAKELSQDVNFRHRHYDLGDSSRAGTLEFETGECVIRCGIVKAQYVNFYTITRKIRTTQDKYYWFLN